MMKKAILFDIDGTLLNSWDFIFGAVKYTLSLHKYPHPTPAKVRQALGKPLIEFYQILVPGADSVVLSKTHDSFQQDRFHKIKLYPKTKLTLKALKDKGFLLAAVSNRTRDNLVVSLKQMKIFDLFNVIVPPEDVKNAKPHPDHLLFALKSLQVKPDNSYMVGDTHNDVLAGKEAGVKTVGVTYGFLGEDIKKYQPDYIIDKIEQMLLIVE